MISSATGSNNKQTISLGVIVRDSKGQLQHASAIHQNLNKQVEIAAWDAILFALQKAHPHGGNQIQILCDSKDIVFNLQRKNTPSTVVGSIAEDIHLLAALRIN